MNEINELFIWLEENGHKKQSNVLLDFISEQAKFIERLISLIENKKNIESIVKHRDEIIEEIKKEISECDHSEIRFNSNGKSVDFI